MYSYYVYAITNIYNNVLYIGVTNDLIRRIFEHRNKLIKGFSSRYNCYKLVWFEETNDIINAITKFNPNWVDLYGSLIV